MPELLLEILLPARPQVVSFGRQPALLFSAGQQQALWNPEQVHGDLYFGGSLDESKGIITPVGTFVPGFKNV